MRVLFLLSLFCAVSAFAADRVAIPMSDAEKRQKLARASALKEEGGRMEAAADAKYKADKEACYKKFLAASCLDEAKRVHTQSTREASRKTLEGGELERDVKRSEVAVHDAKRAAEAPQRAADQKAQAEAFRETEAKKADAREAKAAEKQQQAADGRKKRAEDMARHEKKMKENAEKQAKAAEKRKAREAARASRRQEAAASNP